MRRTLYFPAAVADAAATLGDGGSRKDEMLAGAFWVLERDAESGRRLWQDPPLYAVLAKAGQRGASVSVLYTIDFDRVVVLSLAEGTGDSGFGELSRLPAPGGPERTETQGGWSTAMGAGLRGIGPEGAGY